LAALETLDEDDLFSARVVTPRETQHASFELTSGTAEVVCMSAMTMTARRAVEIHHDLKSKWGGHHQEEFARIWVKRRRDRNPCP